MTTLKINVLSSLPPHEVISALTDFGPSRAKAWPGIDDKHLTVHETGEGWADVTEGNAVGWERERYTWDAAAGRVSATTTDSNIWGPGSGWAYQLTPADGGTRVGVTAVRNPKGIYGRIVAALLAPLGNRLIAASLKRGLKATVSR
jgi:YD repeat-containing protein